MDTPTKLIATAELPRGLATMLARIILSVDRDASVVLDPPLSDPMALGPFPVLDGKDEHL